MHSSDAVDGRSIKIVGRARAAIGELEAPISGVRCVAWRLVVQLAPGEGAGRTVVDESEVPSELCVDDGSSLVRVRAERRGSPCVLWSERGEWVEASTPALRALLGTRYVSTRTSAGRDGERDRRLWLREDLVLPGDRVAVLGIALWETDAEVPADGATYREAKRSLVVVDTSDRPVVLSPRPDMWR